MSTIDEKRVYDDQTGKTEAFVATGVGVVVVDVSDDLVGGFRIARRCTAADVAAAAGRVAVATDEDVLVTVDTASPDRDADAEGDGGGAADGTDAFESTDFGPAVAVGFASGDDAAGREGGAPATLAADADGRVARRVGGGWETLGRVGAVRAVDRGMVAAADGVHLAGDDLRNAGLEDVADVAAAPTPLAATPRALYKLGNGWMVDRDGAFRAVSAGNGRTHAVGKSGTFARVGDASTGATGEWVRVDLPTDERVVDIAQGPASTCAVTDRGTFLVDAGDGWRSRALGLHEVGGLAIR